MRRTLGFLLMAALAASAGCGGGGEAAAPTVATPSEPGTTTGVTDSEAEALAESMLLRLSDFPTGWRADPPDEEEGACSGIDELGERYDLLAEAFSDTFAEGESTEAASTARLFHDEKTAGDVSLCRSSVSR
jgi:hypothetical protein